MRLDSVPAGIHGYSFEEEGDADDADAAEFSAPAGGRPALVDEDEEEQEAEVPQQSQKREVVESDDEEAEVAPAPVPARKVVSKAKVLGTAAKTVKK